MASRRSQAQVKPSRKHSVLDLLDEHPITNNGEQVMAHQPAISFSISFQHPFNRAGGRTSNVRQEIMTRSRIIVGLAVLLVSATPLYLLSSVTYGVRYGILTEMFNRADILFPTLARILWPFGPLDWWSYITPVALAVGAAARIRSVPSFPLLSAMLAFSIIQSIVILGAFEPFAKIGSLMGYPEPAPYPMLPLAINLAMVMASVAFAATSIWRAFVNRTGNHDGEHVMGGNRR